MDCLFCNIIAKQIPCYTVYENEDVVAFLDIHPCSKGHTVVVPKKHAAEIDEISVETWHNLMAGLKKVVERVETIVKPDGLNVGLNNKSAAGQAVPHLHWHVIPRFKNDGGGSMHSIVKTTEEIDVKKISELFA